MKKTTFQQLINPILILLGCLLAFKMYGIYKGANQTATSIVKDIKNDFTTNEISKALGQNNIKDVRTAEVTNSAENIYNAFHKDSLFGFGEDEQKAIDNFNELKSIAEAKACASIYKLNFKKSMYNDFLKYCNGSHFKAIKTSFLNSIKSI